MPVAFGVGRENEAAMAAMNPRLMVMPDMKADET